jgi:hypothetical protein
MNTRQHPHSSHQPHELTAFFEFFGCTLLGTLILFPLFRLVVPATFFNHHSDTFGVLAFLICGGILAPVFNYVAKRRKKWPFD